MRIDVVLLTIFAAAASAIALLWWRRGRKLGRLVTDLAAQCAKAESDKASLTQALSVLDSEENERISRLEHDVKSSLGVILGFSSLPGNRLNKMREHLRFLSRALTPFIKQPRESCKSLTLP